MNRRYLTKSRYKIAQECPTKLYYADRPDIYENKNLDNEFLKALAHGGFQVGALARLYFPGGTEVVEQDHELALKHTADLLSKDCVVIYEAAFRHNNLFRLYFFNSWTKIAESVTTVFARSAFAPNINT